VSEQSEKGQDPTEEPTDKRRDDFRKKGQTAKSADLTSIGLLIAVSLCIGVWSDEMADSVGGLCVEVLTVA